MIQPELCRSFLKHAAAASIAVLFFTAAASSQQQPNIVFIFSDDHAENAISAYGSRINKTPNIDRIAREGAIFLNNTCGNSICAPSRAAILTGKHSHANGQRTNGETFDSAQMTFPKLMQQAGYQTAMIGKWHLRSDPTGFDHWEILPGQGSYYNPDFYTADGKTHHEGYVTDVITDLSLEWLDNQRDVDKPFVLMSQHKAPHRIWAPGPDHLTMYDDVEIPEPSSLFDDFANRAPVLADNEMMIADHMMFDYDLKVPGLNRPDALGRDYENGEYARMTPEQKAQWDNAYGPKNEAFIAANLEGDDLARWKYQRYIKDYLRSVASVDDNIGRVLDYLDENGLADNTIVIYSSDQGFYLGEHGMYDKRWMYKESFGMPLVMRWPNRIEPGTRVSELTQNIDFAPTFLEAAGVSVPDEMQGESLVPLAEGNVPGNWRKALYYRYYEGGEHNVAEHEGVRTDRYKLIHYYVQDQWELFDLENDPEEMNSVYDEPAYADRVAALKRTLEALKDQYDVPDA
jgi:N-acetylglucosamine-6-sulfatase